MHTRLRAHSTGPPNIIIPSCCTADKSISLGSAHTHTHTAYDNEEEIVLTITPDQQLLSTRAVFFPTAHIRTIKWIDHRLIGTRPPGVAVTWLSAQMVPSTIRVPRAEVAKT
jgi:hypothetical protein